MSEAGRGDGDDCALHCCLSCGTSKQDVCAPVPAGGDKTTSSDGAMAGSQGPARVFVLLTTIIMSGMFPSRPVHQVTEQE
jgi:hypothetical protein